MTFLALPSFDHARVLVKMGAGKCHSNELETARVRRRTQVSMHRLELVDLWAFWLARQGTRTTREVIWVVHHGLSWHVSPLDLGWRNPRHQPGPKRLISCEVLADQGDLAERTQKAAILTALVGPFAAMLTAASCKWLGRYQVREVPLCFDFVHLGDGLVAGDSFGWCDNQLHAIPPKEVRWEHQTLSNFASLLVAAAWSKSRSTVAVPHMQWSYVMFGRDLRLYNTVYGFLLALYSFKSQHTSSLWIMTHDYEG